LRGTASRPAGGRATLPRAWADIRHGVHATSPSILLEDTRWLTGQGGRMFVDPEIGHMGRAAASCGIEFGFLHVVSQQPRSRLPG
jgi:hypothetical protein